MANQPDPRISALQILRGRLERGEALERGFDRPAFLALRDRDRRLATELVYGVLRNLTLLDEDLRKLSRRPRLKLHPQVRWVLRIALYQLRFLRVADYAVVDGAVSQVRRLGQGSAAKFVNGVLRSYLRDPPELPTGDDASALARRFSHPQWLVQRYLSREGVSATRARLEHNNRPPEAVVRVNSARTTMARFCRQLERDEIECTPVPGLPDALRLESRSFVQHSLYERGHCYFMDAASQRIVQLCRTDTARRMADLCAAPGSKTFALSAGLRPGVTLVSVDLSRRRLTQIRKRAALYGEERSALVQADCRRLPLGSSFDRVLLDVPCSGLGTIRANPDIRWTFERDSLARMADRQREMLGAASRLLVPGGRLIYATCSSEPEENEAVVEEVAGSDESVTIKGKYYCSWVGDPKASGYFAATVQRQ